LTFKSKNFAVAHTLLLRNVVSFWVFYVFFIFKLETRTQQDRQSDGWAVSALQSIRTANR